jgi:hypothetical protein
MYEYASMGSPNLRIIIRFLKKQTDSVRTGWKQIFNFTCWELTKIYPFVGLFPIFSRFLESESPHFGLKLRTMYLPGGRPEFLIRYQEMLGMDPEPDPLQMGFFSYI